MVVLNCAVLLDIGAGRSRGQNDEKPPTMGDAHMVLFSRAVWKTVLQNLKSVKRLRRKAKKKHPVGVASPQSGELTFLSFFYWEFRLKLGIELICNWSLNLCRKPWVAMKMKWEPTPCTIFYPTYTLYGHLSLAGVLWNSFHSFQLLFLNVWVLWPNDD